MSNPADVMEQFQNNNGTEAEVMDMVGEEPLPPLVPLSPALAINNASFLTPFTQAITNISDSVQSLRLDTQNCQTSSINKGVAIPIAQIIDSGEEPVRLVTPDLIAIIRNLRLALRDGLRNRGRGFFGPLISVQPTAWPIMRALTSSEIVSHIESQVDEIFQEGDTVALDPKLMLQGDELVGAHLRSTLLELAWLVQHVNDGTLADYVSMLTQVPISEKLVWCSQSGKSAILDNAKMQVLKEVTMQVCDLWISVDLKDFLIQNRKVQKELSETSPSIEDVEQIGPQHAQIETIEEEKPIEEANNKHFFIDKAIETTSSLGGGVEELSLESRSLQSSLSGLIRRSLANVLAKVPIVKPEEEQNNDVESYTAGSTALVSEIADLSQSPPVEPALRTAKEEVVTFPTISSQIRKSIASLISMLPVVRPEDQENEKEKKVSEAVSQEITKEESKAGDEKKEEKIEFTKPQIIEELEQQQDDDEQIPRFRADELLIQHEPVIEEITPNEFDAASRPNLVKDLRESFSGLVEPKPIIEFPSKEICGDQEDTRAIKVDKKADIEKEPIKKPTYPLNVILDNQNEATEEKQTDKDLSIAQTRQDTFFERIRRSIGSIFIPVPKVTNTIERTMEKTTASNPLFTEGKETVITKKVVTETTTTETTQEKEPELEHTVKAPTTAASAAENLSNNIPISNETPSFFERVHRSTGSIFIPIPKNANESEKSAFVKPVASPSNQVEFEKVTPEEQKHGAGEAFSENPINTDSQK